MVVHLVPFKALLGSNVNAATEGFNDISETYEWD